MKNVDAVHNETPRSASTTPEPAEIRDLLPRAHRFAFSLTHDAGRAEDLVQDAWLAVFRARGPWNTGYVFSAIRSRFIDQCRRERLVAVEPLDETSEISDPRGFWHRTAEISCINGALDQALQRLRPEERAALVLSAVEGHTAQEIADLLDCPRGTVLSLLHRTRKKLQGWLLPE